MFRCLTLLKCLDEICSKSQTRICLNSLFNSKSGTVSQSGYRLIKVVLFWTMIGEFWHYKKPHKKLTIMAHWRKNKSAFKGNHLPDWWKYFVINTVFIFSFVLAILTSSRCHERGIIPLLGGARGGEGREAGKLFQRKLLPRLNACFYNRLQDISWHNFSVHVIFSVKGLHKCVFGSSLLPTRTPKIKIVGRYTDQGQ